LQFDCVSGYTHQSAEQPESRTVVKNPHHYGVYGPHEAIVLELGVLFSKLLVQIAPLFLLIDGLVKGESDEVRHRLTGIQHHVLALRYLQQQPVALQKSGWRSVLANLQHVQAQSHETRHEVVSVLLEICRYLEGWLPEQSFKVGDVLQVAFSEPVEMLNQTRAATAVECIQAQLQLLGDFLVVGTFLWARRRETLWVEGHRH